MKLDRPYYQFTGLTSELGKRVNHVNLGPGEPYAFLKPAPEVALPKDFK